MTRGITVVSIRRATAADAATVHLMMLDLAGHLNQASSIAVTPDLLAEFLERPQVTYLIAERAGRAIGYVSWLERVSLWSGGDYLALDDLYVSGEERGQGIGEQLMKAALQAADGRVIRWEVTQTNVAAQRFYERIGATLYTKTICRWQSS